VALSGGISTTSLGRSAARHRRYEARELPEHIHADRSFERSGVTLAKAAQLLNVSVATVKRARVVVEHGEPQLVAAVEQGRVSVSGAEGK
jgi:hypothetical protein